MKYFSYIVMALVFLMLAACGNTANEGTEETTEQSPTPEISIDSILQQSIEAMTELQSFSMEVLTEQEITFPGEDTFTTTIEMVTDVTQNPVEFYQKMTMDGLDAASGTVTSESYFVEEGVYMINSTDNQWVKFPDEFAETIKEASEAQLRPEEQLQMLTTYAEEITVTEEENHYVLAIQTSGADMMEMTMELMSGVNNEFGMLLGEMMHMMEIESLNYEIFIDKDTFYQTKMNIDLIMHMDIEGNQMTSVQSMTGTMFNFNGIERINIPQEAIDTAEQFSFDFLEGLEDFEIEEIIEEEETTN